MIRVDIRSYNRKSCFQNKIFFATSTKQDIHVTIIDVIVELNIDFGNKDRTTIISTFAKLS